MKLDADTRRRLERCWSCRLTTRGRRSGEPRQATVWFALGTSDDGRDDEVWLTGGPDGPHWWRNLRAHPEVEVVIDGRRLRTTARAVEDEAEAERLRRAFVERYLAARLARPFGGYTRSTAARLRIDAVERA